VPTVRAKGSLRTVGEATLKAGRSWKRLRCDYAGCVAQAVVALRFGDGKRRGPGRARLRQSFAFYCLEHGALVQRDFLTCDERRLPPGPAQESAQA
jgi:hypothetical protein